MKLGYSQKELARLSGVDQSEISLLERGQKNLSARSMESLAAPLHLDVEDLLDLWRFCNDPVSKAILACHIDDDAKLDLLGRYAAHRNNAPSAR